MNLLKFKILIIATFCFLFSAFLIANAAGFVPCGPGLGKNCTFCDLLVMSQRIFNFALTLAVLIVIAAVVWGGFTIMFAAGSAEKAKKGRSIIQSAVIGLIIAVSAWLIVDITLRVLTGTQQPKGLKAPWYQIGANIKC